MSIGADEISDSLIVSSFDSVVLKELNVELTMHEVLLNDRTRATMAASKRPEAETNERRKEALARWLSLCERAKGNWANFPSLSVLVSKGHYQSR